MADRDTSTPLQGKKIIYQKVKTTPTLVKVILADGTRIGGYFHPPHSLRLTDLLNRNTQDSPFLAVTDAHVIFTNGEHAEYKFFTVNRAMIICCFPDEEEVVQD